MNYRDNTFDLEKPLCSFGPGGDFTAHWNELLKDSPPPQTKLGRLLAILAEVVTATAASGRSPILSQTESEPTYTPNIRIVKTETKRGVHIKAIHSTDAKAAGAAKAGRAVPGQLLLFGLDAGNGGNPGDKQDHSIRAHHRSAKKKPALRRAGQGSLFEADPSRAISA